MTEQVRVKIIGDEEVSPLMEKVAKSSDELGKAYKDLSLQAGASFAKMEKSMDLYADKATKFGKSMSLKVSAPIAALGALTIKTAADFEKGMSDISTVIDTTVEDMKKMGNEVQDIAKRTPVALGDLTSALYDVRSAGISAADSMTVLERSAQLGVAGLGTTKEAVNVATSAINAFRFEGEEAAGVFDVLMLAVKNGKTTIADLSRGFGGVAGLAKEVGVTFEELMATTAAMTATGLKASESYSSIKQVISNVAKPTAEAIEWAKKLNIQFDAQALRSKGLAGFMGDLAKATDGNKDAVIAMFGSVEGLNTALSLTGANAENFNSILESMQDPTGVLSEAFAKQSDTFMAHWQIMRNNLSVAMVKLGSEVLPMLSRAADNVSNALQNMNPTVIKVGAVIALLVATIGPLSLMLGATIKGFLGMYKAIKFMTVVTKLLTTANLVQTASLFGMTTAAGSATASITGLSIAIKVLAGPIGWAIAAVGLLAVAWKTNFMRINDIVSSAGRATSEFMKGDMAMKGKIVAISLKAIFNIFRAYNKDVLANMVVAGKKLAQVFIKGLEFWSGIGDKMVTYMTGRFIALQDWLNDFSLLDTMGKIGNTIIDGIWKIGEKMGSAAFEIGQVFKKALKGDFSGFDLSDLLFDENGSSNIDKMINDIASSDLAASIENMQKGIANDFSDILGAEEFGFKFSNEAIDDFDKSIAGLAPQIEAVKLAQDEVSKTTEQITLDTKNLTDQLEGSGKAAEDSAKEVKKEMEQKQKEIAKLQKSTQSSLDSLVKSHTNYSTKVKSQIADLKKELSSLKDSYEENLSGINKNIGESIVEQENKIKQLKESLKNTDDFDQKAKIKTEISVEEDALNGFMSTLPQNSSKVNQLKDDIAALESQLGRMSRFKENQGARDGVQSQIDAKQADIDAMKNAEGGYQSEIEEARRRQSLTGFQRDIEDFNSKVELLKQEKDANADIINAKIQGLQEERAVEQQMFDIKKTEHAEILEGLKNGIIEQKELQEDYYTSLGTGMEEASTSNADMTTKFGENSAIYNEQTVKNSEAHWSMVTAIKEANETLINSIQVTVDKAKVLYEQLKQTILQIKSVTAPAEGPDRRSTQDVAKQFDIQDPTSGSFVSKGNITNGINSSAPQDQSSGFSGSAGGGSIVQTFSFTINGSTGDQGSINTLIDEIMLRIKRESQFN